MDVEPYDHLRAGGKRVAGGDGGDGNPDDGDAHDDGSADGDDLVPGVYRVVGVGEAEATLLRVTDADGRRVRSGHVERVEAATVAALDPAEDPDAGVGPVRALASLVQGLFWSVRGTLRRLVP